MLVVIGFGNFFGVCWKCLVMAETPIGGGGSSYVDAKSKNADDASITDNWRDISSDELISDPIATITAAASGAGVGVAAVLASVLLKARLHLIQRVAQDRLPHDRARAAHQLLWNVREGAGLALGLHRFHHGFQVGLFRGIVSCAHEEQPHELLH